MFRKITGFVLGYIVLAIFLFITFSILYLSLGTDKTFEPNTYQVTTTWVIGSIILSFISSYIGGWFCMKIAKSRGTVIFFAIVVLLIDFITAVPKFETLDNAPMQRSGDVTNMEAMKNAKSPAADLILIPIVSAFGIWEGGKKRKVKAKAEGAAA
jgi:magnesium-transporting ATPase (P-type)